MPTTFTLNLGGYVISLAPDFSSGAYHFVDQSIDFQTKEKPSVVINVHRDGFPDLAHLPAAYETIQGWKLFQADGKSIYKIRDALTDPLIVGVFPADFCSGDFYLTALPENPDLYKFPFSFPMGELYMMNLLGTGSGMLIHGVGVIYRDQAYLFAGNSGAGKTTTGRLWKGTAKALVVNDDKVIIRKENDGFRLYGTPWPGEGGDARPNYAPLARVFILKQAKQNSLAQLTPVQAAGMLLGRAFAPLWDSEKIACTLKFLDELCQVVPCQEFSFLPDQSAVDYIKKLDE